MVVVEAVSAGLAAGGGDSVRCGPVNGCAGGKLEDWLVFVFLVIFTSIKMTDTGTATRHVRMRWLTSQSF